MNPKTKFLTLGAILVIGAILLSGAACVRKAATPIPEGAPASKVEESKVEKPAAKKGDIGKMTDNLYVEITAKYNYSLGKAELKYLGDEGFATLLKEHGVSQAEWEAFNTALASDTARSESLSVKLMQRLQEMSK